MAKKNNRPAPRAAVPPPAVRQEFNPDYTNVKKDLRRIGLVAGSLFIGLIVLSFFVK